MKIILIAGIILIALGIASLVVPIPHSESHGVDAGDMHIGMKTTRSERVSPIVSVVMVAGGVALAIAGMRTGVFSR